MKLDPVLAADLMRELSFGLNPTLSNPDGFPGVACEMQSADTMLPAPPDSFSAGTTTVITGNATTLKVRDNFLIGTSPPRFMRVKVTTAP